MRKGRLVVLMSLLVAAVVVLAGCGPRATGGELAKNASDSQIVVDLPALVIDVQSDGSTSIGGMSVAQLGGLVGQNLSTLSVPLDTVQFLTASNIQHFQIDTTPSGLLILVNGEPVPSLAWDGDKLVATAQVLEKFGPGLSLLQKVLPLVRNLGVGVIIRFPIAQGAQPIPLVVTDDKVAQAAMAAQQEFLKAVGTPPTFQVVIQYAADGTWSVADLSQQEWSQLAPIPWQSLNLSPAMIQAATASGIQEIGLATNTDGIFISINGQTLPYITWADGRVNHLLTLAQQTGLLNAMLGSNPNMDTVMQTVQSLLPAVQASKVNIKVKFPS